jgi:hypothetical protein
VLQESGLMGKVKSTTSPAYASVGKSVRSLPARSWYPQYLAAGACNVNMAEVLLVTKTPIGEMALQAKPPWEGIISDTKPGKQLFTQEMAVVKNAALLAMARVVW